MTNFTANWDWPQWLFVAWLASRLILVSAAHGEEMLVKFGKRAGKPQQYSGFVVLFQTCAFVFILTCGGFFA